MTSLTKNPDKTKLTIKRTKLQNSGNVEHDKARIAFKNVRLK